MPHRPNATDNPGKGQPSTGTVKAHVATLERNNRPRNAGYLPEGTPAEALCKPGQRASLRGGKDHY